MPRQATRSAANRGPLDKLRGPVRKMAEEVFSVDTDRSVLKDEPLMNGLSELQTKQALKVLDTYCQNVQRQGSGRIQNKAAYLMSLIQSYKLGPSSGSPGSAQRLVERLSPAVRRAVDGVFDPVVDRVVLEDRALMELLAKVPEEQALAALKKYRATVQRRGRDAIDNRCGYLIGFLKQYQDGVAVMGVSNNTANNGSAQPGSSRGAPTSTVTSNGDHLAPPPKSAAQTTPLANGNAMANGSRGATSNGSGGVSAVTVASATKQVAASSPGPGGGGGGGGASGVRPILYLQESVRKQLEKLFESGKDKAVLEDVGLIKQLARLGEEQALAALKNYKEASKHRRDIHNKSAYLMGILRGYIEGTTPITKGAWEGSSNGSGSVSGNGGGSDDGPASVSSFTQVAAPMANSASGNRSRTGRGGGRGSGTLTDDTERMSSHPVPNSEGDAPQQQASPPPPPPPSQQQQQQPPVPAPPAAPSLEVPGPREFGGFANAPAVPQPLPPPPPQQPPQSQHQKQPQHHQQPQQQQQQPQQQQQQHSAFSSAVRPMPVPSLQSFTSPLTSPPLGGGLCLGGVGLANGNSSSVGDVPQHRYDSSNVLLYINGGGGVPGFGIAPVPPPANQPPRHASPHESLFGHSPTLGVGDGSRRQHQHQTLVGPGLLGGEFLSNGGGSDRGLVHNGPAANGSGAAGPSNPASPGNPMGVLFGSGLLAGDELGGFGNGSIPASPGSASGMGSTSGVASSSLSGVGAGNGSRTGSPLGSEGGSGGHDSTLTTMPLSTTTPMTSVSNTDTCSSAAARVGSSSSNSGSNGRSYGNGNELGPGSADWALGNSASSSRLVSAASEEGRENLNSSEAAVGGMIDMLARLNLSKYVPVLAEAEVDMDALRLFGEDDLKDLGFPKGPRIKLLHEVQNLKFTPRT